MKSGKFSRNIGQNTPQAVAPKLYRRTWNVENAKHQRLSRPISEFLNDKLVKQKEIEVEAEREREKQKLHEDAKRMELNRIIELIKSEKDKVRICTLCKRKFSSL